MANLKEIRTRITSVTSTKQITGAMKMVAAAKLKKAQNAATSLRPYMVKMQEIMMNVALSAGADDDNIYAEDRTCRRALIVVITSNRGLCGAFNANAVRAAVQLADRKYGSIIPPENVWYLPVGKKGYDLMRRHGHPMEEPVFDIIESPAYGSATTVAQLLMNSFVSKKYDCIDLVYNEFVNAASQKIVCKQFLPMLPEELHAGNGQKRSKNAKPQPDRIFEPSLGVMLRELIPQNLRMVFYEALLDSVASEFGARMTSMHQATDNALALIRDLTVQYNKARQAAITGEILEIVGGAEALKK